MNILTWNLTLGTFKKDNGLLYNLYTKPTLSFNFDVLIYEPITENAFYAINNSASDLSPAQIAEIEAFISGYDLTPKHSMNEYGSYLGQHPDFGQFTIVPSAPPTNENWKYVNDTWVYVHGVDIDGHYMGNVPSQLCYAIATSAPVGFLTKWDDVNKIWTDERTDEQKYLDAIRLIDRQRDEALADGFIHTGHLFHCDPIFQTQVQAYLAAWREGIIAELDTVSIRRKDNVTIQMTKAEMLALAAALMAHVQNIYAQSWAAKDAL